MNAETIALQCPKCGSSETADSRVVHFGCEFKCKHCKTTSVLVINNKLHVRAAGEHVCGTCGKVASGKARFCQCGSSLVKPCRWCHQEIMVDHSICDQCGRSAAIDPKSPEGYAIQEKEALQLLNSGNEYSVRCAMKVFESIELSSTGKEAILAFIRKDKRYLDPRDSRFNKNPNVSASAESPFHEFRYQARSWLKKLGPSGLAILADMARSRGISDAAMFELARSGEAGIPLLLESIAHLIGQKKGIQNNWIHYLGECGAGAVPILIEFLKPGMDSTHSYLAEEALIRIGRPALPALQELTGFWRSWLSEDAALKARALEIISKIETGA